MSTEQPIVLASTDHGEETARADLYGVLAALLVAPPSAELVAAIAAAPADGVGVLGQAWLRLAAASAAARDADSSAVLRDEYERLFIGVGKPEVMLYGSYYLSGFLMEKPLALLRTDLAHLGIERAEQVVESEDHIASLCEVMRYLIAEIDDEQAGAAAAPLSQQQRLSRQKIFYATHMQPWVAQMCANLSAHPQSKFYQTVAEFAQAFFEVEAQAFDMV